MNYKNSFHITFRASEPALTFVRYFCFVRSNTSFEGIKKERAVKGHLKALEIVESTVHIERT